MKRALTGVGAVLLATSVQVKAQTWHGASQFNDDHAFTKAPCHV